MKDARRTWTPEQDEMARNMWAIGASGGDIANRLGKSRDAVLGRAGREGWKRNEGVAARPGPPPSPRVEGGRDRDDSRRLRSGRHF